MNTHKKNGTKQKHKNLFLLGLPIAFFVSLVPLFIFGLQNDPTILPSVLINKQAPTIVLTDVSTNQIRHVNTLFEQKIWILNIWASWCPPCKDEHPQFIELQKRLPEIPIVGINYKDSSHDARAWLAMFGDPYAFSVSDVEGRAGIAYGVYGVPETFIINNDGNIHYKHIGPISSADLDTTIIPILDALTKQATEPTL